MVSSRVQRDRQTARLRVELRQDQQGYSLSGEAPVFLQNRCRQFTFTPMYRTGRVTDRGENVLARLSHWERELPAYRIERFYEYPHANGFHDFHKAVEFGVSLR